MYMFFVVLMKYQLLENLKRMIFSIDSYRFFVDLANFSYNETQIEYLPWISPPTPAHGW